MGGACGSETPVEDQRQQPSAAAQTAPAAPAIPQSSAAALPPASPKNSQMTTDSMSESSAGDPGPTFDHTTDQARARRASCLCHPCVICPVIVGSPLQHFDIPHLIVQVDYDSFQPEEGANPMGYIVFEVTGDVLEEDEDEWAKAGFVCSDGDFQGRVDFELFAHMVTVDVGC